MRFENLTLSHFENSFEILFRTIFVDSPTNDVEALRPKISDALSAYQHITINIKKHLYPVLLKLTSPFYIPYESFFQLNRENILKFLYLTESEIIPVPSEKANGENPEDDKEYDNIETKLEEEDNEKNKEEEKVSEIEKKEEEKKHEAEKRALDKGISTLMMLFPESGLDKEPGSFDLYPYFSGAVDLKKGSELISPKDPAQYALVLSHIIEGLLLGFRNIQFEETFKDGTIFPILDSWNKTLEDTFYSGYMAKIEEYAKLYKGSADNMKSTYAMSIVNDIQWVRKYYLFPHYDYKSGVPPSFSRKEITTLFSVVRQLRRALTELAGAIESAKKRGGEAEGAHCDNILNPWDSYNFEIENFISKRLNLLLKKTQRTNVSLVFFTLAVCSVLDNLLNDPFSSVSKFDNNIIYRTAEGSKEPVLWMEKRTDTFQIFKSYLTKRKAPS